MNSMILRSTSERNNCQARLAWAFFALGVSWQSRISLRMAAQPSPLRLSTLSSIPCVTWKREVSRSGRRGDQAGEGILVPVDEIFLRRLALDGFLAAARGFFVELEVFDHVLGRLRHHPAAVVKPLAARAAGDLVKIARAQDAGLLAVEFAQLGEEHGADGDVDADAQRVRAADDFEQPLLRQLLDQDAVFGQQPGVMQPDAVPQPFLDVRPVGAGELETFDGAARWPLFPRACRR